jgi:thioredoxin-related protein
MVGCPYCLYMKEKVLSQELTQHWYNQYFRSIRVDIHGATEVIYFDGQEWTETTFAARYGVFSTPTMILFDTDGNEIYRHLTTVKKAEQLTALGKSVLAGS